VVALLTPEPADDVSTHRNPLYMYAMCLIHFLLHDTPDRIVNTT